MKRIMFNDRYGLTEAVIEKRKTVTRRMITGKMSQCWLADCKDRDFQLIVENNNLNAYTSDDELYYSFGFQYKKGEIVAIAQSYKSFNEFIGFNANYTRDENDYMKESKGWTNKMFVRADLMPHQIRILDVRAERLQDITEEDCLREGVIQKEIKTKGTSTVFSDSTYRAKGMKAGVIFTKQSPKEAFASLIDKISGKGTWESNPFVWVYDFELTQKLIEK